MKRILFVDDEQNILDGLQNLFWKHRRQMEMAFALGGEAALQELEKAPFDAIVSDMRMPGMDGATLLQRVKEKYPGMVRIILSGHSEKEAILAGLPVAHQFLSKPCDSQQLCHVIDRVYRLQTLLNNESLRETVGAIETLPSPPTVYNRLVEAASRPDLSLNSISQIIHQDPAMTAKVLQVVNSAAFGSPRSVESVDEAVIYLGIELIKNLTLTVHIFDTAPETHVPGFSYQALQEHAVLTARVANQLMPIEARPQHLFSAGLLHDIGYIVLAHSDPVSFRTIVEESLRSTRPLKDVEKEMLGVTHAEIGAYLLGLWGLPYPIVEGVAFHHNPAELGEPGFGVPAALNVADALINEMIHGVAPRGHNDFDIDYLRAIGADSELRNWRTIAAAEVVAHREGDYA